MQLTAQPDPVFSCVCVLLFEYEHKIRRVPNLTQVELNHLQDDSESDSRPN